MVNEIDMKKGELFNLAILEIKEILTNSRNKVITEVNKELLVTYWRIGEIIV